MIETTVMEELNTSGNLKIWLTVKEASECFCEFLDYFATFLLHFEIITGIPMEKSLFQFIKRQEFKKEKNQNKSNWNYQKPNPKNNGSVLNFS